MGWQNSIYAWLLFLTALATILVSRVAWLRSKITGYSSLPWLSAGVTVWLVGYGLELSVADLAWQIIWAKVQYLGILSVPVFWFILTYEYTHHNQRLSRLNTILLALVPFCAFLLVITNEVHLLVWEQWQQNRSDYGMILRLTHGPVFYLIVGYSYVLLLIGMLRLVLTFARLHTLFQRQSVIILTGAAAPWISNILYVSGLNPFPDLDLTPFAFTVTAVMFTWGLYRYNLLDIVPVARSLVVESMRDALIVFDLEGRVLDLNASAQRMIGSQSPVIGKYGLQVIPFWSQIEGCLNDTAACGQITLNNMPATGIFELFKTILYDHRRKKVGQMLLLRDISNFRRIEAELSNARIEADASSQAKGAFLASMSHELRTPLTVMMGYADLLLESATARQDAESIAQLNHIRLAGEELLTLITDVLDYTRLDSQQMKLYPERFDVRRMALAVVANARKSIEANHNRLEVEIHSPGCVVADLAKAQQILASLLDNAAKFTQNGLVRLEVFRQGDERIVFRVQDTGIGIEPGRDQDLFKPFMQLDSSMSRRFGGAGLGLALSQRLCRLMGGEIMVESTPGQGSVFSFWLPLDNLHNANERDRS